MAEAATIDSKADAKAAAAAAAGESAEENEDTDDDDDDEPTPEAALLDAQAENKKLRAALKAERGKVTKLKKASVPAPAAASDDGKVSAEAEALRKTNDALRTRLNNSAAKAAAAAAGVAKPAMVAKLLDWDEMSDDPDDDEIEEAVKELIEENPFLLKKAAKGTAAGAGSGSGKPGQKFSMNDAIRQGFGRQRMTGSLE